jgi:hypothetical protein
MESDGNVVLDDPLVGQRETCLFHLRQYLRSDHDGWTLYKADVYTFMINDMNLNYPLCRHHTVSCAIRVRGVTSHVFFSLIRNRGAIEDDTFVGASIVKLVPSDPAAPCFFARMRCLVKWMKNI